MRLVDALNLSSIARLKQGKNTFFATSCHMYKDSVKKVIELSSAREVILLTTWEALGFNKKGVKIK